MSDGAANAPLRRSFATMMLAAVAFASSDCSRQEPLPASGKIAIVSVDDELVRETGGWPWPRRMHAALLDRLTDAGVKRIALYFDFSSASLNPRDDRELSAALVRAGGRTILPALPATSTGLHDLQPIAEFRPHSRLACDPTNPDSDGTITTVAPSCMIAGIKVPSVAVALADHQPREPTEGFWKYDIASVPVISAKQILSGKVPRSALAGLTIVVAPTGELARDWTVSLDGKRLPAVYVPILAAEEIMREEIAR